jgi:replicative DNA helicase
MVWEYMPEVFDVMERQSHGTITGLRTGLIDLDSHLSGLQKGDLIIIGGRPRMGKTSLALDITGSVAIDQRKSVCFFSLEMAARQIVERHLFTRARVNGELLRKGKLPKTEYPRLALAAPQFNDRAMKWMIDGATMLTPLRMLSKVRRHRAKYGLDLVVIDNLQKMRPDSGQKDKRLAIAEISEALKNTAKDLDVPVIAISHLSRGPDMRSDPRPVLSDLQESGNIEQDADIVLFVYRESEYADVPEENYGDTELIIAKYRNGSPGDILLRFNHPLSSFENHAGRRQPPPESYKEKQSGSHGDFYGPK